MKKVFNEEEKNFIINNIYGKSYHEITQLFNKQFNRNITERQIIDFKGNNNIKCGKKAHSHNYKPIGTETKRYDGNVYIKIAEPNVWEKKQRYLYKRYIGDIPKNYSVIFADGNKNNFDIDNLILVSSQEKFVASIQNLLSKNKELTKTGILLSKLMLKRRSIYWQNLQKSNYQRYLNEKKCINNSKKETLKKRNEQIEYLKLNGITNPYVVIKCKKQEC